MNVEGHYHPDKVDISFTCCFGYMVAGLINLSINRLKSLSPGRAGGGSFYEKKAASYSWGEDQAEGKGFNFGILSQCVLL